MVKRRSRNTRNTKKRLNKSTKRTTKRVRKKKYSKKSTRLRKNLMKGGSSELSDKLFSYVNLGGDGYDDYREISVSVIIQNMPIGNTLNEYGFQHLTLGDEELKRQLRILRGHLSEGDIEEGIARSATMLMKDFLLQNILEEGTYQKHDTDETKFLIGDKELRLFCLGNRFRATQRSMNAGIIDGRLNTFGRVHTDFCIDSNKTEYFESLQGYTLEGVDALPSMNQNIRRAAEVSYQDFLGLTELDENYCVLNIWLNLSPEPLLHHNLAFIAKGDAPKNPLHRARVRDDRDLDLTTCYSNVIKVPDSYTGFNLEPFCGYLFQSTWVPHFSLGHTVTLEEQLASEILGKYHKDFKQSGKYEQMREARRRSGGGDQVGGSSSSETWDRQRDSCEYRFLLMTEDTDLFKRLMGEHYYDDVGSEEVTMIYE